MIKKICAQTVFVLLCGSFSGWAAADWGNKVRAFSLVPSSQESLCTEDFFQSVRNLKSIGANTLSIIVPYSQQTLTASDIYPYRRTPTDASLACGIEYVLSEGMQFGINMVINVPAWRANIDPVDRDRWFRQMGDLAARYARDFAAPYGARHFSVGTEMYKLVSNQYNSFNAAAPGRYRWPEIIQDVRASYSGQVIYSAQHSGNRSAIFEDNDLMPNLDVLGFSAYFPLYANNKNQLLQEWQRIERETILPAYYRYGKQLVISELGYRPCDFTFERPYDSQTPCAYDGNAQAVAWDAVLDFFQDKFYMDGVVGGWSWEDRADVGGAGNTDYTPWNKPAADTIRSYWPFIGNSGNTPFIPPSDPSSEQPDTNFVFSRTDTDEFRWVSGNQNLWISASCAEELGGATRYGTWSDLNAIAPLFDQAADPCGRAVSPPPISNPGSGYVFSRTDTTEFRWVLGNQNIWISESCAASLGGAVQSGTWSDLNDIAPGFDQAADPCTAGGGSDPSPPSGGGSPVMPSEGYVFARTDKDEFRWVLGTANLWISDDCAASLGGATQSGDWVQLNAIAPEFDQAMDPCSGASPGNGVGTPVDGAGYVFSRTDTDEFRWVSGTQNIWISSDCAARLGGATQSGTWSDLNVVAPEFDAAADPCDGSQGSGSTSGFVFSRSDTDEFRWVSGVNNIWISASCAQSLGGASRTGTWSDLNDIAPGFDQADSPCR